MARAVVSIDGLTETLAALDALPEEFKEQARITLEIGGAIIEAETDARVPVDEGDLKGSLGTNIRADGLQVAVGFGDPKAKWVEFATVDTPAQPSLWPGFRAGARYVRKQMRLWAQEAGEKVRLTTKRGKKASRWKPL